MELVASNNEKVLITAGHVYKAKKEFFPLQKSSMTSIFDVFNFIYI